MNWLKKLMLFKLLILINQLKKLTIAQKFIRLKRKYLTMINLLMAKHFTGRLKQTKLATKDDIAETNTN